MRPIGRRGFLKTASAGVIAWTVPLSLISQAAKSQVSEALTETNPYDRKQLRELAHQALESARAAGAAFADVRIVVGQQLMFGVSMKKGVEDLSFTRTSTIGVRAVVDSTMGFAGDVLRLNADKVASVALSAVSRSRAGRARTRRAFEFAPTPAVNGAWQTPIELDPFTVPLGEQEELALSAFSELRGGDANDVLDCGCTFNWVRRDEIFASTDGSFVEQRTYSAIPTAMVSAQSVHERFWIHRQVNSFLAGGHGYESVSKANLSTEFARVAADVRRMRFRPVKTVDVGRYDLVIGARATAEILGKTIGNPLELDRALLIAANSKGPTYASPPADILGKFHLASELVNIGADRSRPGANATVSWDSEGVKPDDFELVEKGVIMDYITSRQTSPALRSWYAAHGRDMHSHGCASDSGSRQPALHLPNLTLRSGSAQTSEEDLVQDVKHGFFIESLNVIVDQAALNSQASIAMGEEIVNGKRTGFCKDMAVQFSTPQFWKSVDAIGGPRSSSVAQFFFGTPSVEQLGFVAIAAVPILVRKINVINTGKIG